MTKLRLLVPYAADNKLNIEDNQPHLDIAERLVAGFTRAAEFHSDCRGYFYDFEIKPAEEGLFNAAFTETNTRFANNELQLHAR